MTGITRRAALRSAAALSAWALGTRFVRSAEQHTAPASPNLIAGVWTYRSFKSLPDIQLPFNDLEFWRATLQIEEPRSLGLFQGRLDEDSQYGLALQGAISYGAAVTLRFQGVGDRPGSGDWVYDYLGFLIPPWPNGVNQRAAIVGTVVRTKPHKSGTGTAPAGVTGQWIAIKRD